MLDAAHTEHRRQKLLATTHALLSQRWHPTDWVRTDPNFEGCSGQRPPLRKLPKLTEELVARRRALPRAGRRPQSLPFASVSDRGSARPCAPIVYVATPQCMGLYWAVRAPHRPSSPGRRPAWPRPPRSPRCTSDGASAWRDLPTGASVVFALGAIFLACAIVYAPTVPSSLMETCRRDKNAMRRVRTLDRGRHLH